MDENQAMAVEAYHNKTNRLFIPGDLVELPLDALRFANYQTPWLSLESYKHERCVYDQETNDWLIWLVTDFLLRPEIPPIYVDILSDGIALVDGSHRCTAALIAGHTTIRAQLNKD